jgi:hypothetical protein
MAYSKCPQWPCSHRRFGASHAGQLTFEKRSSPTHRRKRDWHDNRHTFVTERAESGAGDEVIMSIAGHVSRAMLSRYSHVRMEAKRRALDEIATRQRAADEKRKAEAVQQKQVAAASQSAMLQ